jgi:hypothetical protein
MQLHVPLLTCIQFPGLWCWAELHSICYVQQLLLPWSGSCAALQSPAG